jgi:hypothetical protein
MIRVPFISCLAVLAIAACHNQHSQQAENQDMSVEGPLANGELPANADIETLPADESSETSSGELAKGNDNPDVNELNANSR